MEDKNADGTAKGPRHGFYGITNPNTVEHPECFIPGSFGCQEALHTASMLADLVDERLCQHSAIVLNVEWQKLAIVACEALHMLYQSIGADHLSSEPTTLHPIHARGKKHEV